MTETAGAPDPRIRLEISGATALLTIDRPDKLNALDAAMVEALGRCCRLVDRNKTVRAVILTGSGERAFSAGGDIDAWSGVPPEDFGRFWVREGHEVFDALARLRQPLIAVLNGHALGGGLELAATADLRVAEAHAKVGAPETGLGMIPGWSGTQRIVRRFGPGLARRMSLLGEVFTAEQALGLGIVDFVVPKGAGLAKGKELAEAVSQRGPRAVEIAKLLINAAEGEERERPLEAIAGALVATIDDLSEGVEAFRSKRKPDFKGS